MFVFIHCNSIDNGKCLIVQSLKKRNILILGDLKHKFSLVTPRKLLKNTPKIGSWMSNSVI